MANIPAGYHVAITSWENYGDNYNTKAISGLTKEQATFYLKFAELFKSSSRGGFGNICDWDDVRWDDLLDKVQEIAKVSEAPDGYDLTNQDHIVEIAGDMFGFSEYYVFRVFESAKVYYFPEEVKEVSDEFQGFPVNTLSE